MIQIPFPIQSFDAIDFIEGGYSGKGARALMQYGQFSFIGSPGCFDQISNLHPPTAPGKFMMIG